MGMAMANKRICLAYHELEIYRQYLNEARRAGFNRYEYADHEETFRTEEQKGGIWAVAKLLQDQTRFLRECNRGHRKLNGAAS
jgi:hypothetical protein